MSSALDNELKRSLNFACVRDHILTPFMSSALNNEWNQGLNFAGDSQLIGLHVSLWVSVSVSVSMSVSMSV